MTSRLYIQKRGPSGGADIDHTAFTGRKGASFFDGNDSLIEMGNRYEMGEASQGEFVLGDPEAEMPRADYEYEISPHVLVTWTEDATGSELWLARTRIVGYDGGRGVAKIDNETEFHVTVEDCNVELRGQAFAETWTRPEETDVERLVALQLYTLNGASSTAPHFRETCEVIVNTSHLCPNSNTVTMPAKKYLPGTQPQEVVQDCAQMAGKMYGVVIHHTGGSSHLCLLYIVNADHTTYLSPCKISDDLADWDPLDPTAPVFEPNWQRGAATTTDFQTNLSGFVTIWGSGEQATYVEYPTNIEIYDYWVEPYNDSVSTSASQSANRAAGMLEERRQPRLTHRPSVIVQADQTDLLAAGMSIQVKFAVALGGVFLDTWQTRRIVELRWEPRPDGTYWAHMEIDRPVLRVAPGRGRVGPLPPVQSEPPEDAVIDYLWEFADDNFDVTDTYPGGPRWQAASGGNIYSGSLDAAVGTQSFAPHPTLTAGDYFIRAEVGTDPSNGTVNFELWQETPGTVIFSAPVSSTGEWVSGSFTMPATGTIYFKIPHHLSAIGTVEISHGGTTSGFTGTTPPPPATGITGEIGTSPYYAPSDHTHGVQLAVNTPIADEGGYFASGNVEEALQELGAGSGGGIFFNVKNYGATGDGTTDDTTAINDAIDALIAAGAGVLYFPSGTYKTTAALTTLSVPCIVRGDGSNDFDGNSPISLVTSTHDTANLFTVTADHAKFENIAMRNDEGAPTAGSAISTQGAHLEQRVDYESVVVHSFYIGIDVQVGAQWSMRDCFIYDPVLYGVKIRNTVNADAGDWSISDTEISSDSRAATAGIRIESAGGGKINNVKINMGYPPDQKFTNGIDVAVTTGITTVILLVTNCSIENVTGHGISVTSTGTGQWRNMIFNGNQFGLWSNNTGKAISIAPTNTDDVEDIVIAGNVFHTNGTARSAVQLTNTDNIVLVGNLLSGFDSLYSQSGSTNISEISGDVAAHLADTTDAHDASAVSVVDTGGYFSGTDVEAALQELGAGGGAGNAVGPILIVDTPAGSPLVFADLLQNEAGDDLLYEEP